MQKNRKTVKNEIKKNIERNLNTIVICFQL